jgi:hypothetical protein
MKSLDGVLFPRGNLKPMGWRVAAFGVDLLTRYERSEVAKRERMAFIREFAARLRTKILFSCNRWVSHNSRLKTCERFW